MQRPLTLPAWQRRAVVAAPPLVVLGFVLLLGDALDRHAASTARVEHTRGVMAHAAALRTRAVDAETGQRGYIITGDRRYLAPYLGAEDDAWALLDSLRRETADNPAQQHNVAAVAPLLRARFAVLNERVRIRGTAGFDAAREAVASGGGRDLMDRLRAALARVVAEEDRLLAGRLAEEAGYMRLLVWLLFAGAAVVIATAVAANALLTRFARAQQRMNEELLEANGHLQEQAAEMEMQGEELQAQSAQMQEMMAELETSNDELSAHRHALEEVNAALRLRTAQAEEANRGKTSFLASMSHELRTPLNAIAGYVDLAELGIYGQLPEGMLAALGRIKHNQRHLLALISDILNFARIKAGKLAMRRSAVPLGEVLSETAALMGGLVQARGLEYEVEACDAALHAQGDPDRIRQIVINLLSNAVKYTEPGGRVRLSAGAQGDEVVVQVEDTGHGIDPDLHETVFDPFVQLTPSADGTLAQGAGLGLSISRELARAMGGDLTLCSTPGAGSTFTLRLRSAARLNGIEVFDPQDVEEGAAG